VINVSEISVVDSTPVSDALAALDKAAAGILLLTHPDGSFKRTVTDGDLRRLLIKDKNFDAQLGTLELIDSLVVGAECSRRDALALMNQYQINHLPVLDSDGRAIGLIERREIDRQILLSTPHLGDAEQGFVHQAFATNWIAPLGPNVDAFEQELAEHVGASHATAVSSGTAAIHLALLLLEVGAGDTVFCSTLTFAASANPIVYVGATPVFIDSDEVSWNMAPAALARALAAAAEAGKLPKAVIVVNLYGQSADMDPLLALCQQYGVPIIEDAAESLGARYKGRASGTFGKLGIYSFNGNKIITTSGGGMLLSEDPALMARAKFLATQARDPAPHYQHSVIGYNYRMSNILAGVGRGQLGVLSERVAARRAVFETYRTALADIAALHWMPEPEWSFSTHWLSVCTLDPARSGVTVSELIKLLADELVEARPVWKPMHLQPVFADCAYYTDGVSSVSDRLFEQGICLPSGSNMAPGDIEHVIAVIRKALLR
jgi:dTDP-4-amino-4,6-dideoxygalactose transaminase